jgi:hypothetical protein
MGHAVNKLYIIKKYIHTHIHTYIYTWYDGTSLHPSVMFLTRVLNILRAVTELDNLPFDTKSTYMLRSRKEVPWIQVLYFPSVSYITSPTCRRGENFDCRLHWHPPDYFSWSQYQAPGLRGSEPAPMFRSSARSTVKPHLTSHLPRGPQRTLTYSQLTTFRSVKRTINACKDACSHHFV